MGSRPFRREETVKPTTLMLLLVVGVGGVIVFSYYSLAKGLNQTGFFSGVQQRDEFNDIFGL